MAETAKERTVRYLQDAYAATHGASEAIEEYIDDTNDPQLKALFGKFFQMNKAELTTLEGRLQAFGETPSSGKNFFNKILAKASEIMHGAHDEYDKNTQNLIKAHALFHLQHAMYQSLVSYTSIVGDQETAAIGARLRDQNEQAAHEVFPYIDSYAKTALAGTYGTASNAYTA